MFVLRVLDVCKLWSLGLSCKMELNFFSSIIDASVNFARTFPLGMKKKKQNKTKQNKQKKMLSIWIENFKVLFLRNSRELGFLCDCIIGVCSLNVLKNLNVIVLNALH